VRPVARVLDPDVLDAGTGPRGKLAIDVPETWLAEGAIVDVVVPKRVACARCDGGGCDGCGRSGAIRLAEDDTQRTLRLHLTASPAEGCLLRVAQPLGEDAGLEQLVIHVRRADQASPSCQRVWQPETAVLRHSSMTWIVVALIVLAAALAAAAAFR
jgi:hypothetical protein